MIVELSDPHKATDLLTAHHTLMRSIYAAQDCYALNVDELCAPDIRFFIARDADTAIGCGAVALGQDYGEIKSMFTSEKARGRGAAGLILKALEDTAKSAGLTYLKLETGPELEAACHVYERAGFTYCKAFGTYPDDGASIFMEKQL